MEEQSNPSVFKVVFLSLTYGCLSVLMVFLNKSIFVQTPSYSPYDLLIIQCFISSAIQLPICFATNSPILMPMRTLFKTFLVNLVFIVAMISNTFSLKHLTVQMVTLLKCLSVVFTAIGDVLFYKQKISLQVWFSIALIIIGSCCGVATDFLFSLLGYFWMLISILSGSSYLLVTKNLVDESHIQFFTLAFWNNLIGMITVFIFQILRGNKIEIIFSPLILGSGFVGLALNISTFSLLGSTSATSYAIVGATKKIVQAVISLFLYPQTVSLGNTSSIIVGMSGATLYSYFKYQEKEKTMKSDETILILTPKVQIEKNDSV